MPRFNVTAEFSLTTEVEPDVSRYQFDSGDSEEFEDSSYFQTQEVTADGGSLSFIVVADDEQTAEEAAYEIISDGQEVEDSNGLTWLTDSVSIEVEEIEVPMDTARAVELVTAYLDSMEGMDDELKAAFGFLLELVRVQDSEIRRLTRPVEVAS